MYWIVLALVLPLSEGLRCYQTDTTSQGVTWENERLCSSSDTICVKEVLSNNHVIKRCSKELYQVTPGECRRNLNEDCQDAIHFPNINNNDGQRCQITERCACAKDLCNSSPINTISTLLLSFLLFALAKII